VADGLLEDVGEIGGGIGGHDENAAAGICLGDRGRAGHRGLAYAAFA
jgi:hypothetical protein